MPKQNNSDMEQDQVPVENSNIEEEQKQPEQLKQFSQFESFTIETSPESFTAANLANQAQQFYDLISKEIQEGEFIYMLSTSFLNEWKHFVHYDELVHNHFNSENILQAEEYIFSQKFNEDLLLNNETPVIEGNTVIPKSVDSMQNENEDTEAKLEIEQPVKKEDFIKLIDEKKRKYHIIKNKLVREHDYIIVNQETMKLFSDNYKGFIIEDKNLSTNQFELITTNIVLICQVHLQKVDSNHKPFYIKKLQTFSNTTLADLKELLVVKFKKFTKKNTNFYTNIDNEDAENNFRLWLLSTEYTIQQAYEYVKKTIQPQPYHNYEVEMLGTYLEPSLNQTIKELCVSEENHIIYEFRENGKNWIFAKEGVPRFEKCDSCYQYKVLPYSCKCEKVKYCSLQCQQKDATYHSRICDFIGISDDEDEEFSMKPESRHGLTGLQNIGNTCFMNSALQCLSNVPVLTNYFLNLSHKKDMDIDGKNRLGYKGDVAKRYANLIKHLWVGSEKSFSPSALKNQMTKIHSMFTGYQQHDSAELLSYLLDALHEDLNKIKVKPYIEQKDCNFEKDAELLSKESWNNFLKRNRSIIVDTFYGQFKSKIICPDCQRISITFDPFLLLSVPIPLNSKSIDIYYIFANHKNQTQKISIKCPATFTAYDLKQQLSTNILQSPDPKQQVYPEKFFFAYLDYYKAPVIINDNELVGDIQKIEKCIFAIELSKQQLQYAQATPIFKPISEDHVNLTIFFSTLTTNKHTYSYMSNKEHFTYCRPLVVPKSMNLYELQYFILKFQLRYLEQLIEEKYKKLQEQKKVMDEQVNKIDEELGIKQEENNLTQSQTIELEDQGEAIDEEKSQNQNEKNDTKIEEEEVQEKKDNIEEEQKVNQEGENIKQEQGNIKQEEETPMKQSEKYFKMFMEKPVYKLYYKNCDSQTEEKQTKCARYVCEFCNTKNEQFEFTEIGFSKELKVADLLRNSPAKEQEENQLKIEVQYKEKGNQFTMYNKNSPWKKLNSCTTKSPAKYTLSEDGSLDIYKCFDLFTQTEKLDQNNEWYCSNCKEHKLASKEIKLSKLPNILLISFKRFKQQGPFQKKKNTFIDFPLTSLDLNKYMAEYSKSPYTSNQNLEDMDPNQLDTIIDNQYDLIGVTNHMGNMGFGHYTANCYNSHSDRWYTFNDESVYPCGADAAKNQDAYVLFYRKKIQNPPQELSESEENVETEVATDKDKITNIEQEQEISKGNEYNTIEELTEEQKQEKIDQEFSTEIQQDMSNQQADQEQQGTDDII